MDETTDPMGSAGDGSNEVEFVGEFLISSGSCSSANDESESDLNIDSTTANSSEYDSPYTSPRALILASKSSEEELVVPQSMVRERHKWIERTLLKANDDMAAATNSNSSTRGVVMKNRHSLPANTTSTASPGTGEDEDVLARVIMTTEARKLSREVAKAKVQADISALGDDNDEQLAEAEENSDQAFDEKQSGGRDYAEVSDLRARAQLKLNSAMELLAVTSSRKTSARNSQRDSPVNSSSVNSTNDEGCKIQEDEVKCESPMQIEGAYIGDIKYDETSKDDEDDDVDEPLQQHQDMSVGDQWNRELLTVESEAQGESENHHGDHVEYIASSTEQHRGDDLSAVQIEGELAHRFESAADLSDIEKQTDQEDEMAKLEEEVRQSVQKRLEQDRMAAEAANRKEHRIDNESINGDTPQASFGCDIEVNNSSNSSGISASLLEKPSDTSDASLPSQVDEILYQGKVNHIHQEEGLRYDSTENEYEDIDVEHGLYSSASQSSEIDPSNDYMDMATSSNLHTPEPMLKMAVAQTSTMNAETRLDALDPLVTRQYVPNNARRLNDHSWREVEKTTEHDTETFTQWNGFNRERMLCMVTIGVLAGLLPSLYAQWTCHFVTGDVIDDNDESTFILNFGLQEFTPIDSSFQGYKYCLDYDSKYNYSPPILPRIAGIAATILGVIPLIVIGVYLHFSMTHKILWISAMWMLYFGSICQISTLSVFLLDICTDGIVCSMGPGAWATVVSSLAWFALSLEMKANSALTRPVKTEGVVVIERQSTFTYWLKKNWNSAIGEPSLSRTAMKMQKRVRKGSEPGRYRPPVVP